MSDMEKMKRQKEETTLKSKIWKTEMLINRLESRVAFLKSGMQPMNLDKAVKKVRGNKWSTQV